MASAAERTSYSCKLAVRSSAEATVSFLLISAAVGCWSWEGEAEGKPKITSKIDAAGDAKKLWREDFMARSCSGV